MSEKDAPDVNEDQIRAALAEELDEVAPRRDLWPSIQEGVRRPRPKPQRGWLVPAFGSAAILGAAVVAILLFATPLLSPEEQAPGAPRPSPPPPPSASVPAAPLPPAATGPAPVNPAPTSEVTVKLNDSRGRGPFAFDPVNLSFGAGESVSFTFVGESQFHTFTVEELGIDVDVGGGETVSFRHTFNTPGTYELICVPHRALGMVGTITVR